MTTDENTGSSDARNRQEGGVVPAPLRSEELAPESYDGQNTTQVSTAGTWVGLATAVEEAPPPGYFPELKEYPPDYLAALPGAPRAVEPGEFLARREQFRRGAVRDAIHSVASGEKVETLVFRGWLSGLGPGVKPFFLRGDRDGDLARVSFEREDREAYEKERGEYEAELARSPDGVGWDPPERPREWPGEEPDAVLPPLHPPASGLRGGADEGSDSPGPVGPHRPGVLGERRTPGIVGTQVFRIAQASEEEGNMEVEVINESDTPVDSPDADGESGVEEVAVAGSGPSRPLKRGRPRKDGSGPFQPPSPTNEELVQRAFDGYVPELRPEDLVPLSDRAEVRRAGGRLPARLRVDDVQYFSSDDETGDVNVWRLKALTSLEGAKSNEEVAVLALNALDRVEGARSRSKNLQGAVSHDLRVSATVARHSILSLCQRSSRFSVDAAMGDTVAKLRADMAQLQNRTRRLREELEQERMEKNKERSGRVYLLGQSRSRDPTPAPSPELMSRGKKRDIRERRGQPPAPDPLFEGVEEGRVDPPSLRSQWRVRDREKWGRCYANAPSPQWPVSRRRTPR